jgi:hypothetical protein
MRKINPNGQVFQHRQRQKHAEEADRRRLMTTWQEMEELAVRCGLSRIQFHRTKAAGGSLPLGMSPDTWEKDPKWRRRLHGMRETEVFMETPEYQKCLQTGQVLPSAQGASAMLSRLRSWKSLHGEPQSPEDSEQAKITGYSAVLGEDGEEKVAAQEGSHSDEDWKPTTQESSSGLSSSGLAEMSLIS